MSNFSALTDHETQPTSPQAAAVVTFHGEATPGLQRVAQSLKGALAEHGYLFEEQADTPKLVLNFITSDNASPYRRHAQAIFVVSVLELPELPADPIPVLYPYLVRTIANMLLVYVPGSGAHFLTLELGHYVEPEGEAFGERLVKRIKPLAASRLVIDNRFEETLEPDLWEGDTLSASLRRAGERLAEWDLLPAPFALEDILSPDDLRHVKRLYGIGGLSYGNLSVRKDRTRFWMSASGVDKSKLHEIGRDILLVSGYDKTENCMVLSIPPEVEPRRVSVDAIEHHLIYREHPEVGAIIHVHAWMEGIASTEFNYPCGTYELGQAVAEKVRRAPDPARAVVGLKNHGLTVTGRSLEDIFERLEDKLIRTVPMT